MLQDQNSYTSAMDRQHILTVSAVGAVLLFLGLAYLFPAPGGVFRDPDHRIIAGHSATTTPSTTVAQAQEATTTAPVVAEPRYTTGTYVEVVDGCGPHFEGGCLNARSAPNASSTSVLQLRKGIVLPVAAQTVTDANGNEWYKVKFTEWIRYPERLKGDMYIAADYVQKVTAQSADLPPHTIAPKTAKRILVDRSEQKLYAYDGNTLFMEVPVSTGLDLTPTPRGVFTIYRKTPSRYMQGPLPGISSQYYDLPGVPWNLYFTQEGGAIHGAYWHNNFGKQWSHGCVNLALDNAKKLYDWAPVGTQVIVRD